METREKLSSEKNTLFQINVVQKWQAKRGSKKQEARCFLLQICFQKMGSKEKREFQKQAIKVGLGTLEREKGIWSKK